MTVTDVEEGEQYEFKVAAVNDAGEGKPSRPSEMVTVQEQPGRPILDLSGVKVTISVII